MANSRTKYAHRSCLLTACINVLNGRSADDKLVVAKYVDLEELSIVVDKRLRYARHSSILQAVLAKHNRHLNTQTTR